MFLRPRSFALVLVGMATLAACSKKDADPATDETTVVAAPAPPAVPRMASMDLGHAVDSTRHIVGGVTSLFGTRDTIYLSVQTENTAAGAQVSARWSTATGQRVDSTAKAVDNGAAAAAAVTEFHLIKAPAWPVGAYRVEVFLDGTSQGIKDFSIKP